MGKKNPKSMENLKPFDTLSKEERTAIASKGGHARAEILRERRKMKDELNDLMSGEVQTRILKGMIRKADEEEDIRAVTFLRDTLGEKAVEKFSLTDEERSIDWINENLREELILLCIDEFKREKPRYGILTVKLCSLDIRREASLRWIRGAEGEDSTEGEDVTTREKALESLNKRLAKLEEAED